MEAITIRRQAACTVVVAISDYRRIDLAGIFTPYSSSHRCRKLISRHFLGV